MEKVKKMDQLIKFLVVFSILLSHIPIDMVYAEEISQSNNTVESNRQESEQVMNHPLAVSYTHLTLPTICSV